MITNKVKNVILFTAVCGCFFLFFNNTRIVTDNIISTLHFCGNKLIPSIFPVMILSTVFSKINIKLFSGQNSEILKIVLFSWLSGFIVGPKQLSDKLENTEITRYALLSSNAGIGFVISYVGLGLWNSLSFGIFLFVTQIVFSTIIFNFSKIKINPGIVKSKKTPILSAISDSIVESTNSMISICGFTVFFSALRQLICTVVKIHPNSVPFTAISAILEISGGALSSAQEQNILLSGFFTGFCVGFGGICMCMQTFAVCEKNIVNKTEFIGKKLIQGILCGILSVLFVKLNNLMPSKYVYLGFEDGYNFCTVVTNTVFCFLVMFCTKKQIKNKLNSI
ncbi:MAG: hypothetical protein E7596_01345 [Ruminococcaceae bacterium]|nr:hypothetical protein [Oscillospiraceae bacterium]